MKERLETEKELEFNFSPEELKIIKKSFDNVDLEKVKDKTQEQLDKIKLDLVKQDNKDKDVSESEINPTQFIVDVQKVQEKVRQSTGEISLTGDELIFLNEVVIKAENLFNYQNRFNPYSMLVLKLSLNSSFYPKIDEPYDINSIIVEKIIT